MKRKNLLLTAAAAAALAAFNPAFAGGGAKHGSADQAYPAPEQSASGSSESRTGDDMKIGAGVSVDRETGDTEKNTAASDATPRGDIGLQASAQRSQDVDPRTGLDRAHPAN
jgi:hypothetical protein